MELDILLGLDLNGELLGPIVEESQPSQVLCHVGRDRQAPHQCKQKSYIFGGGAGPLVDLVAKHLEDRDTLSFDH